MKISCIICGSNRYVEDCHIKPRRLGGEKIMPLCPNHHKLYDNHLLNIDEIERLPPEAYRYYMKGRKLIKSPSPDSMIEEVFGPMTKRQRGIYGLIDEMVDSISIGLGGDRDGKKNE